MRTIAEQWQSFERQAIPKAAGPVQRQEMRRAFYAGFQGALMAGIEIADAGLSDDAGAAVLEGLHDEYRRFGADVQAWKA